MPKESLKKKTVKGIGWSAVEKFSGQGIQFLVTIVIARILTPKDFGLVGMMAVFIAVAQALVDSGFSQALIRTQNRTQADNCTVFYFNIVISTFLYGVLYLIAPWVADFYHQPQLVQLMRVLCLVVVINSFGAIQRALYTATLNFKTQAKASLIASVLSGICGIIMAYGGFGVWALVGQQLLNALFCVCLFWWFSKWRPQLIYSWKSFRRLFAFGSNLLLSSLINTIYGNIYQIVIGKIFSAASLGYVSQAKHICQLPSAHVTGILDRVIYPVLSSMQDDDEKLSSAYRRLLRTSAFIVFPLMCGLAAVSYPLIKIVLGEKWLFSATLMIPISFALMWNPVHAINLDLLKVKGRSDLFLRLEIIKKCIGIVVLVVSIPFGLLFMFWMRILSSLIALFINTYYTGKFIHVNFLTQMRDLLPSFATSMSMFGISFLTTKLFTQVWLQLIVAIIVGGAFYLGMAYILKFKELSYLKSIIPIKQKKR